MVRTRPIVLFRIIHNYGVFFHIAIVKTFKRTANSFWMASLPMSLEIIINRKKLRGIFIGLLVAFSSLFMTMNKYIVFEI